MRCPQCGQWNRASFPRCMKCGNPLDVSAAGRTPKPVVNASSDRIHVSVDAEGNASSSIDKRDLLAQEMQNLQERKREGELRQQQIRRDYNETTQARYHATYTSLDGQTYYSRPSVYGDNDQGGDVIEITGNPAEKQNQPVVMTQRHLRVRRRRWYNRFTRLFSIALLAGITLFAAYYFVLKPVVLDKQEPPLQERCSITQTILNEMPAHMIRIPGQEGASIYIKELRKSYTVTGGYAVVEVADYVWYEDQESVTEETVTATLTPYVKTSSGEQKAMETISFPIDIPLSPLTLVSPDTGYDEVSTQLYNIQFEVAAGSTVTINDKDYSDLVNTQDGLISYNASISAINENVFNIKVRAPYYRENSATVTIYRPTQAIPLELAADIATRWSPTLTDDTSKPRDADGNYPQIETPMTIKCTTVSWANVSIKSPYANLDLTRLAQNGTFSFDAVFDHIGTNTIIIEVSDPNYGTTTVTHDVYYVPIAAIYTRKAWDMNLNYTDYLDNSTKRIANSQIYVVKGKLIEIKSSNPQLGVFQLTDNPDRTVLIENLSNDTWVMDHEYRIYADAYGVYNSMPRLIGRYTY